MDYAYDHSNVDYAYAHGVAMWNMRMIMWSWQYGLCLCSWQLTCVVRIGYYQESWRSIAAGSVARVCRGVIESVMHELQCDMGPTRSQITYGYASSRGLADPPPAGALSVLSRDTLRHSATNLKISIWTMWTDVWWQYISAAISWHAPRRVGSWKQKFVLWG